MNLDELTKQMKEYKDKTRTDRVTTLEDMMKDYEPAEREPFTTGLFDNISRARESVTDRTLEDTTEDFEPERSTLEEIREGVQDRTIEDTTEPAFPSENLYKARQSARDRFMKSLDEQIVGHRTQDYEEEELVEAEESVWEEWFQQDYMTMGGEVHGFGEGVLDREPTTAERLAYPIMRFTANLERQAAGTIDLGARGIRGAMSILGAEETPTLDSIIESYGSPEDHLLLSGYVSELGHRIQLDAYEESLAHGVFQNISNTGVDLMTLMLSMKVLGGGFSGLGLAGQASTPVKHMGRMAAHAFTTTPGEMEDRLQSAQYRLMYNLTPYVAQSTGATGLSAVALDTLLNTMLTSPKYVEAYEKAGGLNAEFLSMAIPQIMTDIAMAWNTRGLPENIALREYNDQGARYMEKAFGIPRERSLEVFKQSREVLKELERSDEPLHKLSLDMAERLNIDREKAFEILQTEAINRAVSEYMRPEPLYEVDLSEQEIMPGLNRDNIKDVPGIGDKTADRIARYVYNHDGINDINELANIRGVGSATLERIRTYYDSIRETETDSDIITVYQPDGTREEVDRAETDYVGEKIEEIDFEVPEQYSEQAEEIRGKIKGSYEDKDGNRFVIVEDHMRNVEHYIPADNPEAIAERAKELVDIDHDLDRRLVEAQEQIDNLQGNLSQYIKPVKRDRTINYIIEADGYEREAESFYDAFHTAKDLQEQGVQPGEIDREDITVEDINRIESVDYEELDFREDSNVKVATVPSGSNIVRYNPEFFMGDYAPEELAQSLRHEIAHALINKNESLSEIVRSNPDNILGSYNRAEGEFEGVLYRETPEENFAEALTQYITDREGLGRTNPELVDFIERMFEQEQLREMNNYMENQVNKFFTTEMQRGETPEYIRENPTPEEFERVLGESESPSIKLVTNHEDGNVYIVPSQLAHYEIERNIEGISREVETGNETIFANLRKAEDGSWFFHQAPTDLSFDAIMRGDYDYLRDYNIRIDDLKDDIREYRDWETETDIEVQGNTLSTINKFSDIEQRFNEKFDSQDNNEVWIMKNPNKSSGAYQVRFPDNKKIYDYRAKNLTELAEKLGLLTEKEQTLLRENRDKLPEWAQKSEPEGTTWETLGENAEGTTTTQETNVGYHAGDLGKGETLLEMDSGRGTGHYGTGTYFVGSKESLEGTGVSDRPVREVSFDDYNLYKPEDKAEGFMLHDFLRDINRYAFQGEFATEEMPWKESRRKPYQDDLLEVKNELFPDISDKEFLNQLEGLKQYVRANESLSIEERRQLDTPSTRFMKSLGYEGIDVRGIEGLDNTQYGSVIYDVKQEGRVDTQQELTVEEIDNLESKYSPPETLYRGVTQEELDFIIENGYIKSNQSYNLEGEKGRTLLAPNRGKAERYATGFLPQPIKNNLRPGEKTYVIEIANNENLKIDKNREELYNRESELLNSSYSTEESIPSEQIINVYEYTVKEDGSFEMTGGERVSNQWDNEKLKDNNFNNPQESNLNPNIVRDKNTGNYFVEIMTDWGENTGEFKPLEDQQVTIHSEMPEKHKEMFGWTGEYEQVNTQQETTTTREVEDTTGTDIEVINLNSATIDDLTEVKGIGTSTAQNIINYRDSKENGIESVDDLLNVKGIGQASLDKMDTDRFDFERDEVEREIEREPGRGELDDIEKVGEDIEKEDDTEEVLETREFSSTEAQNLLDYEGVDIRDLVWDEFEKELDEVTFEDVRDNYNLTEREKEAILAETGQYYRFKAPRRSESNVVLRDEDGNLEPVTKRDIENTLRVDFELAVGVGERLEHESHLGEYNRYTEVIKARNLHDYDITAHEVGHHIVKRLDLNVKDYDKLVSILEERGLAKYYPDSLHESEGAAEFFVAYFQNPGHAAMKAPGFYKHVEDRLAENPDLERAARKLQSQMTTWNMQDYDARLSGSMSREDVENMSFMSLKDSAKKHFVDFTVPVQKALEKAGVDLDNLDVLENPINLIRLFSSVNDKVDRFLNYDRFTPHLESSGKSLREILAPVREDLGQREDGLEFGKFETYALAKHAIEREALHFVNNITQWLGDNPIENRNTRALEERAVDALSKGNIEELIEVIRPIYKEELYGRATGLDINDVIEGYRNLGTEQYDTVIDELAEYKHDLVRYAAARELISEEAAQSIINTYNYHLPLYRLMGEDDSYFRQSGTKIADLGSPFKSQHGSTRIIKDPIGNIIRDTQYIIREGDKNRIANTIIRGIESEQGHGALVREVDLDTEAFDFRLQQIEGYLKEAGLTDDKIAELDLDTIARTYKTQYFTTTAQSMDNVVTVRQNGEVIAKKLHPDLYDFFENFGEEGAKMASFAARLGEKAARGLAGLYKASAVLTPRFWIRNLVRDEFREITYAENGAKKAMLFSTVIDGMSEKFGMTTEEIDHLFTSAGGARAGFIQYLKMSDDPAALKEFLGAKNVSLNPLDWLAKASKFTEDVRRRGFFVQDLEGKDINKLSGEEFERAVTEAAMHARGGVLEDYAIKGSTTQLLDRYFLPFSSAGVTGLRHMYNMFERAPIKTTAKAVAFITAPAMALWYQNKDKEEYQEMPEWRKAFFYNYITDEGTILSMPKPFALGFLFGSVPEAIANYKYNKDGEEFLNVLKNVFRFGMPNASPSHLMPVIELIFNRRLETGIPIETEQDRVLRPGQRYNEFNSEFSKFIGGTLNVSPKKLDHLIRGNFPGLGHNFLDLSNTITGQQDWNETILSVLGSYDNTFQQPISVDRIYQERDKYNSEVQNWIDDNEFTGRPMPREIREKHIKSRRLNNITSQINSLRQRRRLIDEADVNQTAKDNAKKILTIKMINLAREYQEKNEIDIQRYMDDNEYYDAENLIRNIGIILQRQNR